MTALEGWYTQKCVCDDLDSSCDIAKCYGVPETYKVTCECEGAPVPSQPEPETPSVPQPEIPSPPVCVWREIVSPCRADCFGDDQDQKGKRYTTNTDQGTGTNDQGTDSGTNDDSVVTSNDQGKDSGPTKDEASDSGSTGNQPTQTSQCPDQGCLTVTRACYCDGVLSEDGECSSLEDLPLTETFECSLNCPDCEWTNLSEWSDCVNNTQYLTRECSCEDNQSSDQSSSDESSNSYSLSCNGYTRIFQSCETDLEALSVENWQSESWPLEADTQNRTFTCSDLTWYDLVQKSSLDDDWESLAVQYIAAQLNLLSGVSPSDKIYEDLQTVDTLLQNCSSQNQTQEIQTLLSSLTDFNQGGVKKSSNAKEAEGAAENNANSANGKANPQLLLLILIPAVLLVIGIIVVVVVFIKRRVEHKETVTNTL
jgi:hypothetical protein